MLMMLFSLLMAVYLMNLLIGLLSNAIEKDNNRASYLIQKAKVFAIISIYIYFYVLIINIDFILKFLDFDRNRIILLISTSKTLENLVS